MTNAILRGKPDAGKPHVRFDEGEVASAMPRRGSLLYNLGKSVSFLCLLAGGEFAFAVWADAQTPLGLVFDDFVSDQCGGIAGWNDWPESGLSERRIEILPELTADRKHILRVTKARSLRLTCGPIRLVPDGKYRLSVRVRTKGLGDLDRLQYLLYGYDGWHNDWTLDLPKDTGGEWREVSKTVTLAAKGNGNCTLCFYANRPFAAEASLDLACPRLEALDEQTAETAELVFTDWDETEGRPAGEIGSRVAFHYVGCDPFFVRENVDFENIRALNRGFQLK